MDYYRPLLFKKRCHVSFSVSTQDMFVSTGPKETFDPRFFAIEMECLVCISNVEITFKGRQGWALSDVITDKAHELLYFVSDPPEASPYQIR